MSPLNVTQGGCLGSVGKVAHYRPQTAEPHAYNGCIPNEQTSMNGYANYETWNAALWIGNDEFLYNTAKACVTYREGLETPWDKFVRCMMDGQIGRHLCKTGDGVAWNDPAIDADEMNEMLWEL